MAQRIDATYPSSVTLRRSKAELFVNIGFQVLLPYNDGREKALVK
jgi:hypothetical protein